MCLLVSVGVITCQTCQHVSVSSCHNVSACVTMCQYVSVIFSTCQHKSDSVLVCDSIRQYLSSRYALVNQSPSD